MTREELDKRINYLTFQRDGLRAIVEPIRMHIDRLGDELFELTNTALVGDRVRATIEASSNDADDDDVCDFDIVGQVTKVIDSENKIVVQTSNNFTYVITRYCINEILRD